MIGTAILRPVRRDAMERNAQKKEQRDAARLRPVTPLAAGTHRYGEDNPSSAENFKQLSRRVQKAARGQNFSDATATCNDGHAPPIARSGWREKIRPPFR